MILCIHRTKPNWAATKDRPRFEIDKYWVETDGPPPTMADVDAVLNPPLSKAVLTTEEKIAKIGLSKAELLEFLGLSK